MLHPKHTSMCRHLRLAFVLGKVLPDILPAELWTHIQWCFQSA